MPTAAPFLPRSRSLQRRRGMTAWWIAIGTATAANLLIVILLSQASRMHGATPPPPLATYALHQVQPPAPATPPPAVAETGAEPTATPPAPISLPSLDLPATATTEAWPLPAPLALEQPAELPLLVPAFTILAPASSGTPLPIGTIGLSVDTPAQRLGGFDLDRHYPRTARARGITGRTRLRLSLDSHGEVTAWEVVESTPPGVFEAAAARVVRSLRYRPAESAGQAVPSVVDELIEWTIR